MAKKFIFILVLLGVVATIFGISRAVSLFSDFKSKTATLGVITNDRSGISVVQFNDKEGKVYNIQTSSCTQGYFGGGRSVFCALERHSVGDQFTVLYSAENPKDARVINRVNEFLVILFSLLVGIGFLAYVKYNWKRLLEKEKMQKVM